MDSPACRLVHHNGLNWQGAAVKCKLAESLMVDFSLSVQHSPTHFMKLQSTVLFCEGNSSITLHSTSTDVS